MKTGDLVFQTTNDSQSGAILVSTLSPYTHTGIIKNEDGKVIVIEAVGPVEETPFADWIEHGILNRIAIYRDPTLTEEQAKAIVAAAESFAGKPYDIFFSFNNDAIYCSELPYLAFKAAGIPIGTIQKIAELNFDNALVRKLISRRWQSDEECAAKRYDFEQCFAHILDRELVTPASIAADSKFKRIYSNYPF